MIGLQPPGGWQGLREVLCLGAHCDDIEIGCGGFLAELAAVAPSTRIVWVVFSADDEREAETRRAAELLLEGVRSTEVVVKRFRNAYFPWEGPVLKEFVQSLAQRHAPDLVLTHALADRHQDHRTIAELTWNAFRDHLILEYEIPKYEGDLGHPNVFVPIAAAARRRKLDTLAQCFPSQTGRDWFSESTFDALLRIRGIECASPSGYAEAFHARKTSLSLS